jgi:hypothetical protein
VSEFVNQGPVPLESDAYEPRAFEDSTVEEIAAGRWVLLLGPRQHGKTTGIIRLTERLRGAGFQVASADLQGLPPNLSYAGLLDWVSSRLAESLNIALPAIRAGEEDFLHCLEAIFPPNSPPAVVFIDEAANIRDDGYRNSFYGQIRQIANLRAGRSISHIPAKVRFVFAGTFRPERLVDDVNSPFNVCRTVETDDLSLPQAKELARRIQPAIEPFVERVFDIVASQPFLLQTSYEYLLGKTDTSVDKVIRRLKEELPQLVRAHLESIFGKVINDPKLLIKVAQMAAQGATALIPADSDCSFLQVLGVAKRDGAKLVFRNAYREVAQNNPNIKNPTSSEIVLLIHGIRTDAHWAEMVCDTLQDLPRRRVIPVRYGFMDLFQFLGLIRTAR